MKFPPLFPSWIWPKRKLHGPVEFASFSGRTLAMSLDIVLPAIVQIPIQNFFTRQLFPQTFTDSVNNEVAYLVSGLGQGHLTLQHFYAEMLRLGLMQRLMFEHFFLAVFAGFLIVWLWRSFATTPGLWLMGMFIIDANTGENLSIKRYILRYVMTVLAALPLGAGLAVAAFDSRKQGLQDKVAQTVVLKRANIFVRLFKGRTFKEEKRQGTQDYCEHFLVPVEEKSSEAPLAESANKSE